eukprot:CAMPEP_0172561700 /NCGR_PEP_ID=MMETSP1067-20121228/93903_1 /TAXON_ID=265564 ORGANISM="Thalassiosira punctigera, Strain Tpunct2005C2" /NCGR_SAMPLE_ID=MMETSP1067 /ASSEMBLY_ACC=CAM_ASM_000444 /LENGTH=65 /DNA_ID=CAMNT_0013351793 /DNA_START=17 /DNA_END=211 /DNA_ORIENTATION=-
MAGTTSTLSGSWRGLSVVGTTSALSVWGRSGHNRSVAVPTLALSGSRELKQGRPQRGRDDYGAVW